MTWEQRQTKVAKHFEFMKSKTGAFVGYVIQFDLECYAWSEHKKLGKYASIGEAKDAVECLDGTSN